LASHCREVEGAAVAGGGQLNWDMMELRIKWKRLSYTHCSWEKLEHLRQLPGAKRVANYCK
jgi:hypothetical protein